MIAAGHGSNGARPDDASLLLAVRDFYETVDPMPLDLPERIRFALALHDLEAEVARMARTVHEAAWVARGAEESRIVTFDSDSLTIMIRIQSNSDGTARVDGWLAPPQAHHVEMSMADKSITAIADTLGRFVLHSVPRGTGRLIVRPPSASVAGERGGDPSYAANSVITPALTLLAGERPLWNSGQRPLSATDNERAMPATQQRGRASCEAVSRSWAGTKRLVMTCPPSIVRSPHGC